MFFTTSSNKGDRNSCNFRNISSFINSLILSILSTPLNDFKVKCPLRVKNNSYLLCKAISSTSSKFKKSLNPLNATFLFIVY